MTVEELRALYNQYVRQAPSSVFAQREIVNNVYRYSFNDENFGIVLYTDLNESNADAAIAETIQHFRELGFAMEWKHLSYDEPTDLKARLSAAGLQQDEEEAVMVLPIADAPAKLRAPLTIDIRRVTTPEALKDADLVSQIVWDDDVPDRVSQRILGAWDRDPNSVSVYVAYMDGKPVSYARNEFSYAGNPFVGLYGGSTLAEYRNRGIYTALIAARLREAEERGAKFVYVDASQTTSMPILQKLGFICIGYATACTMDYIIAEND